MVSSHRRWRVTSGRGLVLLQQQVEALRCHRWRGRCARPCSRRPRRRCARPRRVAMRHHLVGVGVGLVLDALLVFARGVDVVEGVLHFLRRRHVLEAHVGDDEAGVVVVSSLQDRGSVCRVTRSCSALGSVDQRGLAAPAADDGIAGWCACRPSMRADHASARPLRQRLVMVPSGSLRENRYLRASITWYCTVKSTVMMFSSLVSMRTWS